MTRKKAVTTAPSATPPTATEEYKRKFHNAQGFFRPGMLAANTVAALGITGDQTDVTSLAMALHEQIGVVAKNDLSQVEGMLVAQAHTLDAMFCALTRRATQNMGEYLDAADRYMRMALRAQSQCRATLETLATIKNPPNPTFIRQANVAHGPQQVNNGTTAPAISARAQETENPQNRLLEQQHGELLDTRAASTPIEADPSMATVGTFNRAANGER